MIFCDDCRIKKKWSRSPGFPHIGISANSMCEVCRKLTDCHDVPAIVLIPESEKTVEQKLVYKIMQQGYREKAESLMVTYVSGPEAGKLNHEKTKLVQMISIAVNGEIDWYSTYQLRKVAQQGYQIHEESKRNRRTYVP